MAAATGSFRAIRRGSIADEVVAQIIQQIQAGELEPGDRLPSERQLAAQLGIGRPALREATRALSIVGILEIKHGGGIFVSELTPEALFGSLHLYIGLSSSNVEAINEARTVIEGAILEFVAPTITDASLARLRAHVAQIEAYLSAREGQDLDADLIHRDAQEFRNILAGCIKNRILLRALEGIDTLSAATRKNLKGRKRSWKPLIASHRGILAALEKRDPIAARAAVHNHVETLATLYQTDRNT